MTYAINPSCAVLLAVFNGMTHIEEQLSSILEQTDVGLCIYVSIDLSTDGSEDWFYQLQAREPRIKVLPVGQVFGSAGKNFFHLLANVDYAAFDFVAFADQDDIWCSDKLISGIRALNDSHCDGYSSNVLAFWPDGKTKVINKAKSQRQWDYLFEGPGPGCTFVLRSALACLIKKQILKHSALIQNITFHDWYCYAFARAKGFRWVIDSKPKMYYRQHPHNYFGAHSGFNAFCLRLKKIRAGWWFEQIQLIVQAVDLEHSSFVAAWFRLRRFDMLRLARHARQCRRSITGQFYFFFLCFMLALLGGKIL